MGVSLKGHCKRLIPFSLVSHSHSFIHAHHHSIKISPIRILFYLGSFPIFRNPFLILEFFFCSPFDTLFGFCHHYCVTCSMSLFFCCLIQDEISTLKHCQKNTLCHCKLWFSSMKCLQCGWNSFRCQTVIRK